MTKPTASNAFVDSCMNFDALIEQLQALRDDHFRADAENIHWGHIGSLNAANAKLADVVAFLSGQAK